LRFDVLTLFPEGVEAMLGESIIGRARARGHLALHTHQIRDYTLNKQKQVDDYPYGGGLGMVMQADPLYRCWEHVVSAAGRGRTILLSPQGRPFDQEQARRLAALDHLILVCGHYEGVDERFTEACVDEELSLGDFVLTGGEIPAVAVCDAVGRLIPGVLSDEACFTGESHWDGLLEYPQYSRPEVWHDRAVPPVLLSGNHKDIAAWRREQSLARTRLRRPDLWAKHEGDG
jgi:tRNA (guanine37-N1)-methyltransferase